VQDGEGFAIVGSRAWITDNICMETLPATSSSPLHHLVRYGGAPRGRSGVAGAGAILPALGASDPFGCSE
jgi:hypothetical protein